MPPPVRPPPPPPSGSWEGRGTEITVTVMSLVALVLFLMGAVGTGWYHYDPIIDGAEYDPYKISTRFEFGLTRAQGYFRVYDEYWDLDYDLSFEYEEDYSETEEREEFHDIADTTMSVLGVASVPLVAFVASTGLYPGLRRRGRMSPLRHITPLLGMVTAILILLALGYFSVRFPNAVDSVLGEMEDITEVSTHMGGAFYAMGAVAVLMMVLSIAFIYDDRRWTRRGTTRSDGGSAYRSNGSQTDQLTRRP